MGRHNRARGQRGAALVEAALVFPLLVLLVFGSIEYGLIFRDENNITTAARAGARVGTADKNASGTQVNADDDYQILQAVYAALGSLAGKVTYVSIYNARTDANGAPGAGCTGPGAISQSTPGYECDVWSAADFTASSATIVTSPKNVWKVRPIVLDVTNNLEPTYLGVYIEVAHPYLTGLFGRSRQLHERAVFRFEPVSNSSHSNPLAPTTIAPPTTTTTSGPTTTTTTTTQPPTTTTTTQPPTTTTTQPTTTTTRPPTTTTSTTRPPTTTTSTTRPPTTTTSTTRPPTTTTTKPPPTTTTTIIILPS